MSLERISLIGTAGVLPSPARSYCGDWRHRHTGEMIEVDGGDTLANSVCFYSAERPYVGVMPVSELLKNYVRV